MTHANRLLGVAVAAIVLGTLLPPAKASTAVGLHLGSHHWTDEPRNNVNPGIYVRTPSGLIAGAYRNSYWRPTVYAGWSWQLAEARGWSLDLSIAAATGYQRASVIDSDESCVARGFRPGCWLTHGYSSGKLAPLVAPSIATPTWNGLRLRLCGMPKLSGDDSAVVHLSIEAVIR